MKTNALASEGIYEEGFLNSLPKILFDRIKQRALANKDDQTYYLTSLAEMVVQPVGVMAKCRIQDHVLDNPSVELWFEELFDKYQGRNS